MDQESDNQTREIKSNRLETETPLIVLEGNFEVSLFYVEKRLGAVDGRANRPVYAINGEEGSWGYDSLV